MICSNFNSLTPVQKAKFIGALIHAVQSDNICFIAAKMVIVSAEESGIFEGVKILEDGESSIIPEQAGSEITDAV